jgi:quercetin dioxygenase-like cupin family protein
MRRREALIMLAAAAALLAGARPGPTSALPEGSRAAPAAVPEARRTVVLENNVVRAVAIEYPPGAVAPEHEHGVPRVVVVLEGGTLEMRDAGGEARTIRSKAGEVHWRPPERHTVANTGTTPVRVVEIDLLDCPPR